MHMTSKLSDTVMKQESLSDRYDRLCLGLFSGRHCWYIHTRVYNALLKTNILALRHNETQNFLVFPKM